MVSQSKKVNSKKISQITLLLCFLILGIATVSAQTKIIEVEHFDKVIVSPHIQVDFIQGNEESVYIEDIRIPIEKLNVEVSGKTLRIYLDDAKMYTKSEKIKENNYNVKQSIYDGTIVRAIVTYKNLDDLSLRGEETFVFKSPLKNDKFKLKIYGESKVYLNNVKFNFFHTTLYGESYLEIKEGSINEQKITTYGDSEINTLGVNNESAKITTYGDNNIQLMVSKDLKVTAYGDAIISYKGSPDINKGIVIGDTTIRKIN